MKLTLFMFILLILAACCENELSNLQPCLQNEIKDFQEQSHAHQIIRIERPGDPLYWFVTSIIDVGWKVTNSDCSFECITDCECEPFEGICESHIFQYPMEIIWEK